jgi:hypothetical protein
MNITTKRCRHKLQQQRRHAPPRQPARRRGAWRRRRRASPVPRALASPSVRAARVVVRRVVVRVSPAVRRDARARSRGRLWR